MRLAPVGQVHSGGVGHGAGAVCGTLVHRAERELQVRSKPAESRTPLGERALKRNVSQSQATVLSNVLAVLAALLEPPGARPEAFHSIIARGDGQQALRLGMRDKDDGSKTELKKRKAEVFTSCRHASPSNLLSSGMESV